MVMAAVTWFAVLLPVGARAAGSLVTLVDPSTGNKARVETTGSLRVAEYNDPARLPFMVSGSITIAPGLTGKSTSLVTVPRGYRLVIETVSARAQLPSGQRATQTDILVGPGLFYIPLTFAGSSSGWDYYQGTQHVSLYGNPGSLAAADFQRSSSLSTAYVVFAVSGHFVKL